ncbi:MAG: hypothetical protein LM558_00490 [Thermosphaera sp.]|nr:hypothetical protein [Thermosphaera sp.]
MSSELGLISKFKDLALQRQQPQGFGGMNIQSYSTMAVQPALASTQQGEDVLRSLASKIGLSEADIDVCYASRDHYDWCLTLVSDIATPPGSPFPSDLTNLFLKLVMRGSLSKDRIKSLGLDKLLVNIVAGNIKQIFFKLSSKPDRQELVEELDKTRSLISKFSNIYPAITEKAEEIIKTTKQQTGVPVDEKTIVDAVRGKIEVSAAAEKIIQSFKQAQATLQQESGAEQKKGVPSSEQSVMTIKNNAQAPRSEA